METTQHAENLSAWGRGGHGLGDRVGFVQSIGLKSWTGPVFLNFSPEIIKQIHTRPSFIGNGIEIEDPVSTRSVQAVVSNRLLIIITN